MIRDGASFQSELDSNDNLKLLVDRKRPQLQRVNIYLEMIIRELGLTHTIKLASVNFRIQTGSIACKLDSCY